MTAILDPTNAASALPDYDPAVPTFQIWVDGVPFASTQVPALAKEVFDRMQGSRRYGYRNLNLVVVGDRRNLQGRE